MKKTPTFTKLCPFCPQVSYGYKFKTWCGLLRHVHNEHLRVMTKNRGYSNSWIYSGEKWQKGSLIYIRIYDSRYSKYRDIDIKSPEECEELLMAYVTDNPSFRGFMKKD